jgi:biopolymer transport protein ExbD
MNLRRHKRAHSAVEASALSDILFFLLIFFLIISTLASPNAIKLLLPKTSTGKTIPRQVIDVSLKYNDKSGDIEYYIGKQQSTLETLEGGLGIASQKYETPTVVLRADKSVKVEELMKVIDVVNHLHLPMVLAGEKSK